MQESLSTSFAPDAVVVPQLDDLQRQIDEKRQTIHKDSYSMSLGELISMYKDGELILNPEYQRLFRWSIEQKSMFIDSILLGIPIPSIFVAQREDGAWEVVDGLQRLATVFELLGILRNPDTGEMLPRSVLTGTAYLPALQGRYWADPDSEDEKALRGPQRLLIKRAKIDVQIVLKESGARSKYELFQRLNTGGSQLSPMEIRNCLLRLANSAFAEWARDLARDQHFRACADLNEEYLEEMGDLELVCRFLSLRKLENKAIQKVGDISPFLDSQMLRFAESVDFDKETEELAFRSTFELLNKRLGNNAFRRYDPKKENFGGRFLHSAFEAVAIGLGHHMPGWKESRTVKLEQIVKRIWEDGDLKSCSGAGVRANTRIRKSVPLGRKYFSK